MDPIRSVLSRVGIHVDSIDSISVDLIYGGGESNPDGSIQINPGSKDELTIYLENKTWRRKLEMPQIERHIRERLPSAKDVLLVISAEESDKIKLEALSEQGVRFITWNALVDYLQHLADESTDSNDVFLLQQFVEYAEKSGEAWRAKMIDREVIDSFSQTLKLSNDVKRFYTDGWRLMETLKAEIVTIFGQQIKSSKIADHSGRLGAECNFDNSFGSWIFFGILHHPGDHKISFQKLFQPEFAIFLDINPQDRERFAEEKGIEDAIKELEKQGFEFNFPKNKGSPWRLCYWRDPIIDHVDEDVSALRDMFVERLKVLFESNLYRILRDVH
ncbi:MAG: hypothetical protein ABIH46_00410 [Chloroflexota bacterium]